MSKKIKYVLIIPIIILFLFLFGTFLKKYQPSTICTFSGGKYLSEYNECQLGFGITSNSLRLLCALTGSEYNSCASPCRHSPGYNCITVCERVCKF